MSNVDSVGPVPTIVNVTPSEVTRIAPDHICWILNAGQDSEYIRVFDARRNVVEPLQQYYLSNPDRKNAALKHLLGIVNTAGHVSLVWENGKGKPPFINIYDIAGTKPSSMLFTIDFVANPPAVISPEGPKRWLYRLRNRRSPQVKQISLTSDACPIALAQHSKAAFVTLLGKQESIISLEEYELRFAC